MADPKTTVAPSRFARTIAVSRAWYRSFFLLVTGFVFFINDDKAQISKRGKDGRTRANHHRRLSAVNAQPFINPLFPGKPAVQDRDAPRKPRGKAFGELRRQPNLGNQDEACLPARERVLGGLNVNLRFAAAGDAVQ